MGAAAVAFDFGCHCGLLGVGSQPQPAQHSDNWPCLTCPVMLCCAVLQAQDLRLISCLAIDEQGEAVIKELQALATAPKPIADGSKQAADGVQELQVAAAPPAAASSRPAAAAAGTPPAAAGTHPAGKQGTGSEQLPHLVQDSAEDDEDEYLDDDEGDRDEL